MNFLWVFLGGGLGSMARYGIALLLPRGQEEFPWGTFVTNAVSCVLLGFLLALLASRNDTSSSNWTYMWMIGFCGGFSTFSTFTSETFQLLQSNQLLLAGFNMLASVLICLLCFYFGYRLFELRSV